jgi:hypothetical protein
VLTLSIAEYVYSVNKNKKRNCRSGTFCFLLSSWRTDGFAANGLNV